MAKNFLHEHCKEALEKDGWKITHDPYQMTVDNVDYQIDLGAEVIVYDADKREIAAWIH